MSSSWQGGVSFVQRVIAPGDFWGGIQWNMVEVDETCSKYVGSGVEPNLDKTQPSRNGNF